MKIRFSDKFIAWLALLSGLSISAVAIYYSVAGLVSIFAAAVIPITVMGVVLESGKLAATVWLKQNWTVAPKFLKTYLLIAITVLMMITSMGIFGYLSKAHLDQAVPTGDVAAQVSLIDEKIKTEKENIDAARKALAQMDAQVNERLARSTDEQGAERAAQLRRVQQKERSQLQKDIATAQNNISRLNEQRAPIAKELRKVEAEVGPIKYIAALIYGDNPDQNLLESAVRWVIIVIVLVFDPLAVILLLASQYSFNWFRQNEKSETEDVKQPQEESEIWPFPAPEETLPKVDEPAPHHPDTHPYLRKGFKFPEGWGTVPPQVYVPEQEDDDKQEDDEQILNNAADSEKVAMSMWKQENPNSSLKQQRKLLERGAIKELPWMTYLKPKADYVSENTDAALEAAKWAQEQLEESQAQDSKKKDNSMDGEIRGSADQENQRDIGYVQNAEQSGSTLWQRVKAKKNG